MRLRTTISLSVLVAIIVSLFPAGVASAQDGGETCTQFVRRTLAGLGTTCANLEGGMACYGNEEVTVLPIEGVDMADDAFSEPGDRVSLEDVARVETSEFDLEAQEWGIALLKLDAYTGTDEDTGEIETDEVLYLLSGGATVEAAVAPEYDDEGGLILDAEHLAPLQAFYLRNGFDVPECEEALPSAVLIQGPQDKEVDVIVNGVPIRIGSTIVVELLPPGDSFRVTTLFGLATLNPGTPNEILVPPGFSSTTCLDEPQSLGLDGEENDQIPGDCEWTDPAPLTQDNITRLQSFNLLPGNILIYIIIIPVIIFSSGIGAPIIQFFFVNPAALERALEACNAGTLSEAICDYLF